MDDIHQRGFAFESVAFESRLLNDEARRRLMYFPRAYQAALFVRQNLAKSIRLEDVAQRAGMTPCGFSRYFAEKIGITFSTLVKLLRIEHAMRELEHQDASISALAERAGYQSCCTFSRAFKEVTGETPSEYRRRALAQPLVVDSLTQPKELAVS